MQRCWTASSKVSRISPKRHSIDCLAAALIISSRAVWIEPLVSYTIGLPSTCCSWYLPSFCLASIRFSKTGPQRKCLLRWFSPSTSLGYRCGPVCHHEMDDDGRECKVVACTNGTRRELADMTSRRQQVEGNMSVDAMASLCIENHSKWLHFNPNFKWAAVD